MMKADVLRDVVAFLRSRIGSRSMNAQPQEHIDGSSSVLRLAGGVGTIVKGEGAAQSLRSAIPRVMVSRWILLPKREPLYSGGGSSRVGRIGRKSGFCDYKRFNSIYFVEVSSNQMEETLQVIDIQRVIGG